MINRIPPTMLSGGGTAGQVLTSTGPNTPPVYSDPAQVVASSAFLNIKMAPYSATGDGSTNDTAAISAATAGTDYVTLAGNEALTNKTINGITLSGTNGTTMTFPPASASVGYIKIHPSGRVQLRTPPMKYAQTNEAGSEATQIATDGNVEWDATHVYLGNNANGVTVQCDGPLMFTNNTPANSANTGAASALPAAPATYLRIKIDGTIYKVPCYNN